MTLTRSQRVLAIDPTSRGFGFVVLEGPNRLVDWGLKSIRRNKEEDTLLAVAGLTELYAPHALVLEDCADPSSRRGRRVRRLVRHLVALGTSRAVRTRVVSISAVRAAFAHRRTKNKHGIVCVIVERFPELARHRPRLRKPWMSEDERQAIFDALAFALASGG